MAAAELAAGGQVALVVVAVTAGVGFGSLALEPLVVARLRRLEPADAYAVARAAYFTATRAAEPALVGTVVAAAAAVVAPGGTVGFDTAWVSAAFVALVAATAVAWGLVRPARAKLLVLLGELAGARPAAGPAKESELRSLTRRVIAGGMTVTVLAVVALALATFQPGG